MQFHIAVEHHLAGDGYTVERGEDTLLFHRTHEEGGFLGIGRRTVKEPVMKITKGEDGVHIAPEPLDPEFVQYLANYLAQH